MTRVVALLALALASAVDLGGPREPRVGRAPLVRQGAAKTASAMVIAGLVAVSAVQGVEAAAAISETSFFESKAEGFESARQKAEYERLLAEEKRKELLPPSRKEVYARFDDFKDEVDKRFDEVDKRFDEVKDELKELKDELNKVDRRLDLQTYMILAVPFSTKILDLYADAKKEEKAANAKKNKWPWHPQ